MAKVFLPQTPTRSAMGAVEQYGTAQIITGLEYDPDRPEMHPRIHRDIIEQLRDYDPEVDYITTAGNPLTNGLMWGMVFMYLFHITGGSRINYLKWCNFNRSYTPMQIDITDLFDAIEADPRFDEHVEYDEADE